MKRKKPKQTIRKGKYQDFIKVEKGRYRSKSGESIIEYAPYFHEDGSQGWWGSTKGEWMDVFRTLKEALSLKWD